jgi:poly-gamma-glutamate synthesis protein (capsule biosynthesis protein)
LGFDFVDILPKDSDYQLIKDSKTKVDVLIVMVHWGIEYTSQPTESQELIANNLVNSGADVVTGSHPHWMQPVDYINGKPVFYSLGNFVFDQTWSEETKNGLAAELTYQNSSLLKIENLPIYMKNFAQPEWVK